MAFESDLQMSCRLSFTFGCIALGTLFNTLAVLWTQQRWCRVVGQCLVMAFQKPNAPSPTATSGGTPTALANWLQIHDNRQLDRWLLCDLCYQSPWSPAGRAYRLAWRCNKHRRPIGIRWSLVFFFSMCFWILKSVDSITLCSSSGGTATWNGFRMSRLRFFCADSGASWIRTCLRNLRQKRRKYCRTKLSLAVIPTKLSGKHESNVRKATSPTVAAIVITNVPLGNNCSGTVILVT